MIEKRVQFDTVEIREYPIVLSTNPASQYGPSIELGWEHSPTETKSVEEYENARPSDQRRRGNTVFIHVSRRITSLQELGYTMEEIQDATHEKVVLFQQRQQSRRILNPVRLYTKKRQVRQRIQKVKRAVYNLHQKEIPNDIYEGWQLPWSGGLFVAPRSLYSAGLGYLFNTGGRLLLKNS